MAPYKILKQGYMLKEPPVSKRGIRKRIFRYWFVLVEDRTQVALVYFKTEDAYIARQKNEGFIRVDQASNISVVGEYMGHKNAFVTKTPKGHFHLIPESRYDLHEWLFTLHNGLENFKKKTDKIKQRQRQEKLTRELSQGMQPDGEQAQGPHARANTAEHVKPSATAGHTPPYRRAPPPPREKTQRSRTGREVGGVSNGGVSNQESGSPRRKPVRPAPQAPGGRKNSSSSSLVGHRQSQEEQSSPGVGENAIGSPVTLPQYSPPHPLGRTRSYSQDGYSTLESDRDGYATGTLESDRDGYATGTLESNRDGYATLDSGHHVIVDLAISQSDREPLSPEEYDIPSPVHTRSTSEPLVLMQQMSNSLPEMLDEAGDSTSPETTEDRLPGGPNHQSATTTNKHSPGNRHTRHLSLMGGSKKDAREILSRRKPKRAGSMKQRSRSPPNLPPPPPPPPPSDSTLLSDPSVVTSSPEGGHSPHDTSVRSMTSNVSVGSLGFSEVLRTMSSIDQELDAIAENFTTTTIITPSQPPGRPPPPPPSHMEMATLTFAQPNLGPSPIPTSPSHQVTVPSPVPEEVANENGNFCEEEWLCDAPPDEEKGNDHRHLNAHQLNGFSESVDTGANTDEVKPKKQQHRVMFKEEVEAIPSYEPRVDQKDESSGEETAIDEVPTGVAAIKMKLFGKQERSATRYRKDGVLSPKHTHPENMDFSEQYFSTDVMDDVEDHTHITMNGNGSCEHGMSMISLEDNANNNNSEQHLKVTQEGPPAQPQGGDAEVLPPNTQENDGTKEEKPALDTQPLSPALSSGGKKSETKRHNVYESPWDEKLISKYKVIGIVRKTASSSTRVKERSPPLTTDKHGSNARTTQRIQFAEVSTKETPKPFSTEVRNVHSLERNLLKKGHRQSPPSIPPITPASSNNDGSLLACISNTLKATSLYGSDSLLCSEVNGNKSSCDNTTGAVKTTTKGKLEKIKAAHCIEDSGITYSSSVGSLPEPSQYSPEFSSAPNSANSTPYKSGTRGSQHPSGGLAGSRMTKSLDGLQSRDTEVTYNPHMQAHILRSLV